MHQAKTSVDTTANADETRTAQPSTEAMTIGQFARRTRLSYKALRLYDAMGLLQPAFVDADNGYRYYREEQVEQARLIGLLRRLEMPLERIRDVLALPREQASRAISAYWQERESDANEKRRLVRFLESYLAGEGGTMFQIETRAVPEQKVASIETNVTAEDLPKFIQDGMNRLFQALAEGGATPQPHPFVTYHGQVDMDSDGPVEVCVPFQGSLDPVGDVRVRVEPAHQAAFTRITKAQVAFPAILEAFHAVEKHLEAQGEQIAGSPREVYFADWSKLQDDDPACDIVFPYTG